MSPRMQPRRVIVPSKRGKAAEYDGRPYDRVRALGTADDPSARLYLTLDPAAYQRIVTRSMQDRVSPQEVIRRAVRSYLGL